MLQSQEIMRYSFKESGVVPGNKDGKARLALLVPQVRVLHYLAEPGTTYVSTHICVCF